MIDITSDLVVPQILEQNDYLPYGTKIQNPNLAAIPMNNRWQYACKEAQRFGSLDLSLLDFGARMYDPFTARWTAVDPMARTYLSTSPFNYCSESPIRLYDPDGRWVWAAVGAALEYGSQVYNNYRSGKTGYDAWVGDVNFVKVGLSAVNPGKKLFIAKTILVEGAKAAIEYSPNSGFSVNDNPTEVAKETIKNTAISVTVGKILDASSSHTVETTTKEASDAAKKVSSANHKVNHNPSSQKAAEALNKAEERASAAGAQAAGTKALNYTIGANPEATKTTVNIVKRALEDDQNYQRQ